MKVLLANTNCKVGGVSTFMLSLRAALLSLGHQCDLFFFERGTMEQHLPPACTVHFGTLADCLRLVERERIQVVHANNVDWHTGISAVREIDAKLILTAHKIREGAATYGWTAGDCDAFVAVSHWIKEGLQPFTDVPIQIVPNGIDTHRFCPMDRPDSFPPIVAWVGRGGAPRKRLEAFAAIAPALRRAGLRVWVIDQQGPETLARLFPEAARALSDAAEVWRGVPFDEMPDVYREVAASGGCVVSTASMEGLPLTLLEAQSSGCVVIAGNVCGVNECVAPDHGGILYRLDTDPEDLANLVIESVRDRDALRCRQRDAAAHVRQHFSLERMAARYLRIYEESPYPVRGRLATRLRVRLRRSPLLDWHHYVERRWGVAYEQYATSRELTQCGEWRLAARAVRASIRVGPTLYVKPGRFGHLAWLLWRSVNLPEGDNMIQRVLRRLEVSPRQKVPVPCGTEAVLAGRQPSQMGWYAFVANVVQGQSVLDVGCGSGEGLKVLAASAREAHGIDLDERLRRPDLNIEIKSLTDVPDKSFDVVVCLDVIEHVEQDRAFIAELFRVARSAVFVSTPNYTISRNRHPYHVREYTPYEFERLFDGYGSVTLYGGSAHGFERVEITRRSACFLVNALYRWKPTLLAAKLVKRALRVRVWKHQAALVRLPATAARAAAPAAAA